MEMKCLNWAFTEISHTMTCSSTCLLSGNSYVCIKEKKYLWIMHECRQRPFGKGRWWGGFLLYDDMWAPILSVSFLFLPLMRLLLCFALVWPCLHQRPCSPSASIGYDSSYRCPSSYLKTHRKVIGAFVQGWGWGGGFSSQGAPQASGWSPGVAAAVQPSEGWLTDISSRESLQRRNSV